ncbi:hypothetical protein KAR91_04780 [Candidatus Pacearchaeota archaeon]|nr:hypothetical protein [Candidatus Pacearchaeota archaeon]
MDLQNLSIEKLKEIESGLLGMRKGLLEEEAREFSPKGFTAWYERLLGNVLPQYSLDDWIIPIFEAKKIDKGTEIFAWRGSWKTTTISIAFGTFFIGHNPERANLIISSSGANADLITQAIKSIIESSSAWKAVFPNIVPDKGKGWGAEGYEVMRNDIEYSKWVDLNTHRKDPTCLGLGIGSKTLIGKHPDGLLLLDDILDEDNTVSVRQMSAIATKVTGTILPFIVEDETKPVGEKVVTWPIVIGTPWQEDDVYQDVKDTGEFVFSSTPIMVECDESDGVYISHEMLSGWFKLTEPSRYSVDSIIRVYNRSQHKEFMRMYMLNLDVKMEGEGLIFRTYPHQKIDFSEVMTVGVDYMSMIKDANVDLRNRSYYAQAYLFKLPDGRAVIGDGWHGRPTQGEAELQMEKAEATYPGHRATIFEGDGKGEEALQVFMRNPNLTIIPRTTKGKGKSERLERGLGPWLENGTILISDGDTPFLQFLRKGLRKYPQWFLDAIDAMYWAVMGMPEVLKLEKPKERLPRAVRKKKQESPWVSAGSN